MSRNDRERAGARVVLVMLVVLALLGGGGYVAAYAHAQHKTPYGTKIAGINVGGRTIVAAAAALRAGLDTTVNAPITVVVGGSRQTVSPSEVGLGIDYVASVRQAGAEQSWQPGRLWSYYTGSRQLDPVVTTSQMTMGDYVMQLAQGVGRVPRDGGVRFDHQRVEVVRPRAGRTIDPQQAQAAITRAFLSADRTAHVDLVASSPDVDDQDVDDAVRSFANPAMSGPVTLQVADQELRLQPRDFASALSMRAVDGRLQPHVNSRMLMRLVRGDLVGHGQAQDASIALVGGRPAIVPEWPGVTFEAAAVTAAFTAALTQPEGQRAAPVDVQLHPPDFTTRDARHLRIQHRIATFETSYSQGQAGPDLSRAVTLLDGLVLRPGATFSWNDQVGPAVGADPVATALFDAAFDAGYGDLEHHAPATYAGRAPVGRQATVADGADLRFSVDSPAGVLVQVKQAAAAPGRPGMVKVVLWSTAAWAVTVSTSARRDIVEPAVRDESGPGCVPSAGRRGFTVDVTRSLHSLLDPAQDRDETVTSTYAPVDAITCG